jgi:ABC-2 type transport system ATP-binding protein
MTTTSISPYVVETSGLTKRFGDRTVIREVELRVPRGSAFGYLGPNGAGKTTLIRVLLGLTPATAGSMRLLGLPVPQRRGEALASRNRSSTGISPAARTCASLPRRAAAMRSAASTMRSSRLGSRHAPATASRRTRWG